MATSNAVMVTLEEYLATSYSPDRDWVDGEVRERNLGEGPHASLQAFFAYLFRSNALEWNVRVLVEQRVQTSAKHYRIVDVCVVGREAAREAIVRIPPVLCIKILSKDDRMSEMQEKIEDYLGMGVQTVWVIDPLRRKAFNTDVAGLAVPVREDLTVAGTAIRVAASVIFSELDEN